MSVDSVLGATLTELPLVLILRGVDAAEAVRIGAQAEVAGARCLEVTIETPEGRDALVAVAEAARGSDLVVGAGTVTSPDDVAWAREAGAAFAVSPGLDESVARAAADAGLALLPGVATATEAMRALALGLTWVKAFPASVLTPAWVRAVRAPLPALRVVATGGVSTANARDFLAAGATGVGVSVTASADVPAIVAAFV